MRKADIFIHVMVDGLCTMLALMVFALFHHVLPMKQEAMQVVIENPFEETKTPEVTAESVLRILSYDADDLLSGPGQSKKQNRSGRKNNANGKGGSSLTVDEDAQVSGDNLVPLQEKFAELYTDRAVITDCSYTGPNLAITVSEETDGNIKYYVADIHVRDITCIRSALAQDTYGSGFRDSIENMALLHQALLAVNGDYYGNTNEGVVIRNGVIYRANPTACDVCVLYYDGRMQVMSGASFSVEDAIEEGAWQAWTFGPALLDYDGGVLDTFDSTSHILSANPRTAIGYYEPGHYCLVVVDGRGESSGITLKEFSRLFYRMGCKAAYNLDGGNSSIMVWNQEIINTPSGGGRESSDAIIISEVIADE
ncbi:MAG: phosphodiester glycosidase family protein [Clostridia bacterium]|nr:phosphodiester glycosidase family protein [Clostridia bacterium]